MKPDYTDLKTDEHVRGYVRRLGHFYRQITLYALVNIGLILVWLLSGEGYFWPIWVIIAWGIPLFIQAIELKLTPKPLQDVVCSFMHKLPFMKSGWEEEQVDRILKQKQGKKGSSAPSPKNASSVTLNASEKKTSKPSEEKNKSKPVALKINKKKPSAPLVKKPSTSLPKKKK